MTAAKGDQQWSTPIEDPRLILTQETVMADLRARAVGCVRRCCPDSAGLVLDMLGLSEVTP